MTTDRLRAVTAECLSSLADGRGPGALVAVTHGGTVLHSSAIGMSDINHAVPLDMHSVVRVASQTKQFTTLMLLMLEAEGVLGLDDEVQRYLEWLPVFDRPVTLRHLAGNTSGLWDSFDLLTFAGVPPECPSTTSILRQLLAGQRQLNFEPGSQAMYCNTGFILLSEVIEKVTGRSYEQVLREKVTEPLGLVDTQLIRHDSESGDRRAAHYSRIDDAWHHVQWGMELTGEGGLATSMHDLLLWQSVLRRPPAGIAPLIAAMTAERTLTNGSSSPYGLGMVRGTHRGRRWVGHGGSVAGARSTSQYYPDEDLGVVVLANTDSILVSDVARRLVDAALGDEPAEPVSGELAGRRGLYRQVDGDDVFEIVEGAAGAQFRSSNGVLGLESTGAAGLRPAKSVFDLALIPSDDPEVLEAAWCGEPRRYRRLPPFGGTGPALAGRYAARLWDADIVMSPTAEGNHRLDLRSPHGSFQARLVQIDDDLHLVLGDTDGQHPGRSWMATLKVEHDAIRISTDRSKRLPFHHKP